MIQVCFNVRKTTHSLLKTAAIWHFNNNVRIHKVLSLGARTMEKLPFPVPNTAAVLEPIPERRASNRSKFKCLRSALSCSLVPCPADRGGREENEGKVVRLRSSSCSSEVLSPPHQGPTLPRTQEAQTGRRPWGNKQPVFLSVPHWGPVHASPGSGSMAS